MGRSEPRKHGTFGKFHVSLRGFLKAAAGIWLVHLLLHEIPLLVLLAWSLL